ncbi:chondroadherin [Eurosta solidaginis]|uniref:chondroadherin n=1 Tax=Eurosta solidaginis TaxID=178769 RepID=UPI003531032A
MIYRVLLVFVSTLTFLFSTIAEIIDENEFNSFCYLAQPKNTRKSCECNNENASPWGIRAINIDCSCKNLKTTDFSEVLPLYANSLDLSWNSFDLVPTLASDSLRVLNIMHNNITAISNKKFVKVGNLRELYMSWNSIHSIELNSFDELSHLHILDLSHNNLHTLGLQVFRPLTMLDTLNLSWNRQLNQTEGIQEQDFYRIFGVSSTLRTLRLQSCSLKNLVLSEKVPLVELDLRCNSLETIPTKLPDNLEKLDISENLFQFFSQAVAKNISTTLKELYIEDMPYLKTIENNAFLQLTSLNKVSFQNSRQLTKFSENAFGDDVRRFPELSTLIFRGTAVGSFNSTLVALFKQLKKLDLNGVPLVCDCELVWLKEVKLETNGRCYNPSSLRGESLTSADKTNFSCAHWPRWVGGIFILGLIIVCSAGIYAIVMCLRPNRSGVTLRRKVGSGSPYARVTIEPNRQENYY